MSDIATEPCSVYRQKIVKARKEHACSACRAKILPGHYYSRVFCVFEGEAETFRRCGSCEVTYRHLTELCRHHPDGDIAPLFDLSCGKDYAEEWGDEPPDEIARLPFLSADERSALLKPVQP